MAESILASAQPGVFIPPFIDCRPPLDDAPGTGKDGKVCTPTSISGNTEPGRYFPDYASCNVVVRQRPNYPAPPAAEADPEDPRLQDAEYMSELTWVTQQVEASGCTCCHDSRQNDGVVGQWDINAGGVWLTTLSDSGLALFAGLADSSVLGAYPAEKNNGFDRMLTGIPTTDTERMLRFLREEMRYRGLEEEDAKAVPPFGGPIYAASVAEPLPCEAGEGVATDGTVYWTGGTVRYVYVTEVEARNPGVPPNLDLPEGTLFRLDVEPSRDAFESGSLTYGESPTGTVQRFPEGDAPELEEGKEYKLVALADVGFPITNCIFELGKMKTATEEPGGATDATDSDACTEASFGEPCKSDADCGCLDFPYCATIPGSPSGTCTQTGCDEDPSVCPGGASCLDLSRFAPGQPAICMAE